MEKEISYFKLRLQERLQTSFPEFANDKDFLDQRSRWAKNAYDGAFQAGNPIEECEQYADYILFENLYFSKFETIYNIVTEEFASLMMEEEIRPFALKMQKVCNTLFDNYKLSDDFAYTYDFDKLCGEIKTTIALWIEEHGL